MNPNTPPTPPVTTLGIYGKVTDAANGVPLANVCVYVGIPGSQCIWARTDSAGNYSIDMAKYAMTPGAQYNFYFMLTGYLKEGTQNMVISGVVRVDFQMHHQ